LGSIKFKTIPEITHYQFPIARNQSRSVQKDQIIQSKTF